MEHPYGKQYSQEGNPRAYMTMRDYRNLPYQWGNQQPVERNPSEHMSMRDYRNLELKNQQPVGRNPNPPRSMREYRDQWMSAPVYHVPSTETSKAWDEPRPREEEGLRYPSNQGETIHTISEKTLMREKLIILTRRLDEMEMKNQHNIYSVNELSASQPSYYNHQSHGHYGENCQENVQILNQGRPPMSVPFGNSYIQNWKNHSNLPGNPKLPPTYQQQFAPTSQQQQPPPLHPLVEQAILDLTRKVNEYVEENKKIRAHSIVTVEDNLNKKIDGLKDDFEHKWDNLHDSSEDLIDQQECPPEEVCQSGTRVEEQGVVTVQANQETETVESSLDKELDGFQSESDQKLDIHQESILKPTNQFVHPEEENLEEHSPKEECLNGTIVEESCLQQPQQGLVENSESLEIGVVVCLWEKEDAIPLFFTEKSSGHEGTKENIIQPNPIDLETTATAQETYYPLPVAPSVDQVYILPSPAPQPTPATKPKPAAPAPKARSNPSLHAMKNLKILVAFVHTFAITSKKMANAYIAWHSGWFGCGFGFGAPGPRHF